mmetsp:Transcript_70698/g.156465  ORF Transcript_70698/g.156465 Transcript_70698/m.156465 type:complete len:362 (-) Transcript_70698:792-1877(-)
MSPRTIDHDAQFLSERAFVILCHRLPNSIRSRGSTIIAPSSGPGHTSIRWNMGPGGLLGPPSIAHLHHVSEVLTNAVHLDKIILLRFRLTVLGRTPAKQETVRVIRRIGASALSAHVLEFWPTSTETPTHKAIEPRHMKGVVVTLIRIRREVNHPDASLSIKPCSILKLSCVHGARQHSDPAMLTEGDHIRRPAILTVFSPHACPSASIVRVGEHLFSTAGPRSEVGVERGSVLLLFCHIGVAPLTPSAQLCVVGQGVPAHVPPATAPSIEALAVLDAASSATAQGQLHGALMIQLVRSIKRCLQGKTVDARISIQRNLPITVTDSSNGLVDNHRFVGRVRDFPVAPLEQIHVPDIGDAVL